MAQRWDQARVIEALREVHVPGEELSYKVLRRRNVPLLRAMQSYFPTYRDALRAAGIDDAQAAGPPRRQWTEPDILGALREAHARGEDMSLRRFRAAHAKLVGAATGHFGSYARAIGAAGISYAKVRRARIWTESEILAALRRRHRAGKDLSTAGMERQCPSLLRTAAHHFGSYRQAVDRAGIDYVSVSRRVLEHWTSRQVLDGLRRLHAQGVALAEKQVAARDRKLAVAARRLFGSYRKAIEAIGFEYDQVRCSHVRVWGRKRIVQLLRELYREGRDLRVSRVMKEVPGLANAAYAYFGSYRKAVLAAGLKYPPIKNPGPWTASRVLRAIQERHTRGDDLRYSQLLAADEALVWAARHYFGTYGGAVAKAGIDYGAASRRIKARERGILPRGRTPSAPGFRQPRKLVWPAERVTAELRQLYDAGEDVHSEAVKSKHVNLFAAVYRRFPSLHAALQAAGIPSVPVVKTHWDGDAILDGIRAVYGDERSHHRHEVNAARRGLLSAAEKRFGSWRQACRQAGIDPELLFAPRRHWTRQVVLDELREAHRLGKDLSGFRLNRENPPLSGAMIRWFGSHRKALEAAEIEPALVLHHRPAQTAEDVLNDLRRIARTSGAALLTFGAVSRADRNLPRKAHYRFGSLKAAVAAAGLQFEQSMGGRRSELGHWTEQTVLQTLCDLQASGRDLRHRVMKQTSQPLFHAARKLFGSYANAVRQAGIDYWTMSREHAAKERQAKEASQLAAEPAPPC